LNLYLGNLVETLPKVAGYFELKDKMPPREMRDFIRKNIGSPDFLAGGHLKPWTNEIFLFSNAITQGIRSDYGVATNPKTASGWWWKTAKRNIIPKILMFAASLGLFGAAAKKGMDDQTEYDKANYTIVPLGEDRNGKTITLRVPDDETGRLIGGIFWKTINIGRNKQGVVRDVADIASYAGGQVPNISPVISALGAVGQYASGQNPYDFFRGRNVLTDTEFKAGGMSSFKPFISWMFQQLGGGIFVKTYNETIPSSKTPGERVLQLPILSNIAGRFIKVTNQGQTEKLSQTRAGIQSEKARATLSENQSIKEAVQEFQKDKTDQKFKDLFTGLLEDVLGHMPQNAKEEEKANALLKKFQISIERGKADPGINALISAVSNDEKMAVLMDLKETLSSQEFNDTVNTAINSRIISRALADELAKQLNEK